ncbi:Ribosomal protein L7Ae/L30e/S12e/Gadd45 [Syntrophomonas zehnderi OL-4]|uniref:Ribosomal protein L7Ae/L30e/S12e/Gadd45 n=1 Tax=Syntrophomonas zehnderi OL-4 TaxID=690567 RepID=A0A0E4GDX9_9FIRM|nr:ribosomal L7Ae/L30e/S12e/Gadd45 family protein [Syntrophomonas zehnderi]CFX67563.1 Ribosomal protein L7Ae/L30e/S12e/Gadd45 [Syntrophomonas zehnderi OL-4]
MKRVYNLLGLAQRAGKISSGTMAAKTSLLRKRAVLLILSQDISENTKESLISTCTRQKIPCIIMGNKYDLGTAVGEAYRVAITVNDTGLVKAIFDTIEASGENVESMGVVEWPK